MNYISEIICNQYAGEERKEALNRINTKKVEGINNRFNLCKEQFDTLNLEYNKIKFKGKLTVAIAVLVLISSVYLLLTT